MLALARRMFALLWFVAVAAAAGCGSTCGADCPSTFVHVTAPAGINLDIRDLAWSGPACPPFRPLCAGDVLQNNCTHIDIIGFAEGGCDLAILFGDRPAEIVHAQFGPPVMQGCCAGNTIIGDSTFIIPVDPTQIIHGADGGTDAVTVVRDASSDAPDGGADSGPPDAAPDVPASD